jgi:hypothetical protein
MLELKIGQLEYRLRLLKQQQVLSQTYPAHQATLRQQEASVQCQLNQLSRRRSELLQYRPAA